MRQEEIVPANEALRKINPVQMGYPQEGTRGVFGSAQGLHNIPYPLASSSYYPPYPYFPFAPPSSCIQLWKIAEALEGEGTRAGTKEPSESKLKSKSKSKKGKHSHKNKSDRGENGTMEIDLEDAKTHNLKDDNFEPGQKKENKDDDDESEISEALSKLTEGLEGGSEETSKEREKKKRRKPHSKLKHRKVIIEDDGKSEEEEKERETAEESEENNMESMEIIDGEAKIQGYNSGPKYGKSPEQNQDYNNPNPNPKYQNFPNRNEVDDYNDFELMECLEEGEKPHKESKKSRSKSRKSKKKKSKKHRNSKKKSKKHCKKKRKCSKRKQRYGSLDKDLTLSEKQDFRKRHEGRILDELHGDL
ncbi:hypothetical protein WR25_21840 [Diploscapter pachys]|uniref:Uncharacterized protein n=1 Tax=Diploscapter pachys TaxID=2018661 RepID=A0A2A2LQV4_9BILA|nr:hypothetical protein WR25_21840 [Diploscapter pachys]